MGQSPARPEAAREAVAAAPRHHRRRVRRARSSAKWWPRTGRTSRFPRRYFDKSIVPAIGTKAVARRHHRGRARHHLARRRTRASTRRPATFAAC
ncbi:MAG: hypothetical protein MZW92_18670 [Comamonadaceae bacterium]|nr:hypothetical protein [Comamonadaceae bacterium]